MSAYMKAFNKLTKWRMVLTGWQLGTRTDTDPEAQAVRDHREATLIQRAEISALVGILIDKGVFTLEEFETKSAEEAGHLEAILEERFPGFKATDFGMTMDTTLARETTKNWKP